MTSIVPYRAYGQLMRASGLPYRNKYVLAAKAAKYAWNNKSKFASAARTINAFLRKRQQGRNKPSYARITERNTNKRLRVSRGPQDKTQKKITSGAITTLPEDLVFERVEFPTVTGLAVHSGRLTQRIFLHGILCDDTFYNPNNYDVNLHWALLQYKEEEPTDWGTEFYKDFFRDFGANADRSRDYVQGAWNYDNETMGINKDKWNVLTHKRIQLGKDTADSHYVSKASHRDRSYFKINIPVCFETTISGAPTQPFYIATWWQPVIKENTSQFDDTISHYRNRVLYWRNLV